MKFGLFQSLALKKEKNHLNATGTFHKSYSFHYKFMEAPENKAIFIVKKKLGNSPTRNKIKRRLRATLALLQPKVNFHILIIVNPQFLILSFQQVLTELQKALLKITQKLSKQ